MTPRVAIVCSGLGHVLRGNETWAATVGEGLHKSGGNVIVFGSGARPQARSPYLRVPCWRRDGWIGKFVSWDKAYLWEQITFARNLRRHLRPDRFDIVHTADPNVAQQLIAHARRVGLGLIYQDSLLIGPEWCSKFEHVQVLAPNYEKEARTKGVATRGWRAISQLVDTRRFSPDGDKEAIRKRLFAGAIDRTARVVLAVGDFSENGGKRMDWIIAEAAGAREPFHLVLAGNASKADCERLRAFGEKSLNGRIHFLTGVPHEQMPDIFRAADVFAHGALREPFGLVLIEAMASGLPVIAHNFETTRWIVGDGGRIVDMTARGEMTAALDELLSDERIRAKLSAAALLRARCEFDAQVVLPKYHEWYGELTARLQRR
jgi:glycosyltransferase involved in cell wall biosynthesis